MSLKPALSIKNLTVTYQKKPVLWSIDLDVPTGVLACIVGPNGAGKSTLIKSIMGIIPVADGSISIFNDTLKNARQRVSYVPQRSTADWDFPVSVMEVVLMGRYGKLGLFKRPRKADKELAQAALEEVGMQDFAQRQIAELSGGQQQRVFLARALTQNADIYFMDEPFAGVDAATESAIIKLLKKMRNEGKTVIVVHHDLQTAGEYFDYCILLNMRIIAHGEMKETFSAKNLQDTYGGKLTLLSEVSELLTKNL